MVDGFIFDSDTVVKGWIPSSCLCVRAVVVTFAVTFECSWMEPLTPVICCYYRQACFSHDIWFSAPQLQARRDTHCKLLPAWYLSAAASLVLLSCCFFVIAFCLYCSNSLLNSSFIRLVNISFLLQLHPVCTALVFIEGSFARGRLPAVQAPSESSVFIILLLVGSISCYCFSLRRQRRKQRSTSGYFLYSTSWNPILS